MGAVSMGSVTLSIKDSKIPIENVLMPQYIEASLRILRLMISEDGAGIEKVMDYVNYCILYLRPHQIN